LEEEEEEEEEENKERLSIEENNLEEFGF